MQKHPLLPAPQAEDPPALAASPCGQWPQGPWQPDTLSLDTPPGRGTQGAPLPTAVLLV